VKHLSVLLDEVILQLPNTENGLFLDLTAGGGGHTSAILEARHSWKGECWDQDSFAETKIRERNFSSDRLAFRRKNFAEEPTENKLRFNFLLADLGVSSFQFDDLNRGMSLKSEAPVDFRMDRHRGVDFKTWISKQTESSLEDILIKWGEEPRAKKLARQMLSLDPSVFLSARQFADAIAKILGYDRKESRTHPATRAFQAFRMAVNDEFGSLVSMLNWTPKFLAPKGKLAIISFHSIEDRLVKNTFQTLAKNGEFDILTVKPIVPGEKEVRKNPRARSAKLRVLEKI
jgi:16S rRNA (cytosine1402-N4)-methyltransferase